jgi:hypothetical protein
LAAIHNWRWRGLCQIGSLALGFAVGLDLRANHPGVRERSANISVFGIDVERNQSIAMHAVHLKPVANPGGALAKYHRAFSALYSDFFLDHEMPS